MGEFLSYSIVSGVLLLAMYLIYKIMLAGEKQFAYNRGVLLAIYAVAFLAVPVASVVKSRLSAPAPVIIEAPLIYLTDFPTTIPDRPVWGTVLIWVFMAGMIVVATGTAATWIRLIKVISRGRKERRGDYTLVVTDDCRIAPFSWMHYMVVGRADYESGASAIIAHELSHINRYHWVDLLVAQVVVIVNWFNPAAWLMREELMLIHEYQADMAVIEQGHDARQYQMLLIKKAVGARFPSLANSLNHSKLKKRITMMYQKKPGRWRRLKAIALVPACCAALSLTAIPSVKAAIATIGESPVTTDKVSKNSTDSQTDSPAPESLKITGTGTLKKEGGADVKAKTPDGKEVSGEGVTFYVDGVKISEEEMKKISPDEILEVTVNNGDDPTVYIVTRKSVGEVVMPEVLPVYKDGLQTLMNELSENIVYPAEAHKNRVEGRAVVEFYVLADGSVTGVRIKKSSGHAELDKEAIRAVNGLRNGWKPGTVNGKPVNCSFVLPVNFKLESKRKP
ncbi:MAG: M56 family metallopeptidase [Duncaniella sp.]|nr:M56 family metallopeptidase [Duncaniella sp.]